MCGLLLKLRCIYCINNDQMNERAAKAQYFFPTGSDISSKHK